MILNVVCETTAFLWIIYWVNMVRTVLFLILPIVMILVISIKFYKNMVNTNGEYKTELAGIGKKIIALVIVILVPLLVNIVISFAGYEFKDTYETCQANATLDKISYFADIEAKVLEVKDFIAKVKISPTVENLTKAESEVSKLYGIANGSIIEDLEYELASIRSKVTMTDEEFICKGRGGIYENGNCNFRSPIVASGTGKGSQNGMVYYTFKNQNDYLVVNTKLSVADYIKTLQSKRICQKQSNGHVYNDQCLCFAEEHLHALTTGDTHKSASQVAYTYYSGFVNKFDDNDKSKILNTVYSELISNHPIILQVNGNRNGTSRHYVAVIGFKSSVTGPGNLKDSDFLLIDSYDCQVEQLHDWGTSRFMTTGAKCNKTYSGYQVYMLK